MGTSHGMWARAGVATASMAAMAGTAGAQVWTVNTGDLSTRAEAYTEDMGSVVCNIIQNFVGPPSPFAPGFLGSDTGQFVSAGCGGMIFTCPLSAYAYGDVRVDGVGTPLLRMRWRTWTNARHICVDSPPPTYRAFGEVAPFNPFMTLDVAGVPNGTNVQIDYGWQNASAAFSRSEAGFEDQPSHVVNTSLVAGGAGDLFALGGFNFDLIASGLIKGNAGGQLTQIAGNPWVVSLTGDVRSEIKAPGKGFGNKDVAGSFHVGELWMTLDPLLFPIPPGIGHVPNPTLKFSVDIGSDTELSPPFFDGDEVFDPGDLYPWFGPPLGVPTNGMLDDVMIFAGVDPAPDPLVPIGVPNSAPSCAGLPIGPILRNYFDLDGTDCTDFDLSQIVDPIAPNPGPIAGFPSSCVWEATNLTWSYDDDRAEHYTGTVAPFPICAVPTNSLSPFVSSTWGTAAAQDEVMSGLVVPGIVPTPMGAFWGVASESVLHPSLAPDPDVLEEDDDDVDALDIVGDVLANGQPISCPFWYFSADHEAIAGPALDPGDIYLVTAAGPVMVVDAQVHLGLLPGTDVDAFEFAFVNDQQVPGGTALVLLFSVDDDDPLTAVDESGGLNPAMIYISYFTGISADFLAAPLDDDVDALSVFADAIPPVVIVPTEACCYCDGSCADLTPNDCLATGGFSQGAGSVCVPGACEPYGACCFGQVCVDNMTQVTCQANGGTYQGDCVPCAIVQCQPTGACCFTCSPAPMPPCPNPQPVGPPCIDNVTQADCTSVLHGIYRGDGSTCIDLGGNAICRCVGDVNGDGVTNAADFVIIAGAFGSGIPNCVTHVQGDLNCDGVVNAADFTILAGNFGCQ